ncbi:MAG: DUF4160 domain-containing protein, partial [Chitinivibrionales bacterium]
IKMYFSQSEHGIAHFHAIYGEFNGVFRIDTLEMIEGDMPLRAKNLIVEWATRYKDDLLTIWNGQGFKQLPGLE